MVNIRIRFDALMLAVLLVAPISARSQDPAETHTDKQDSVVLEEIIVTGSRVMRSDLDSPSPVLVFDATQLENTGITTLGEFARYLPQNADTFSDSNTQNSDFHGSSAFNLRGIGLDGTLTLINGRRIAPFGGSGDTSPFVDINSIPVAAIDRIEVLLDGASAIYGSDAVAGVVNIITKKQIEGMTVEGGYLTTGHGDGEEWDVNLSGGWSNATTSFTGTLSYFDRALIWSRDRDWSKDADLSDRGGFDGRLFTSSPPSAYLVDSDIYLADPQCPEYTETNSHIVFDPGVDEGCLFDYAQFTTLQQPSDRLGLTSSLDHSFTPDLDFFAEFLWSRNRTQSVLAPTPFHDLLVPASHPDNPFGEDVILWGRIADSPSRLLETDVTSWRALAGLKGTLRSWSWEAALMASESETVNTRQNAILKAPFETALQGFGGSTGDQYYNPFGLNPVNSQDVIDQFLISGTGQTLRDQEYTADWQVSGKFGHLAGGPIGAAFGVQARWQKLDQSVDEEELSGAILGGGGINPLNEKRDIQSAFAEMVLPLYSKLEMQLAARWDHYSDFGSTTNPKVGLGWRPREQVLVRATWGTSFRPPTFRELYDPLFVSDRFSDKDPHRCAATGKLSDCKGHPIDSEFGGNPNLKPDQGETWLLGVAWQPVSIPGLSWAVNYWRINHTDRIFSTDDPYFTQLFLELLDPYDNPFILRAEQTPEDIALGIPGAIIGTRNTYVNGDTLDTDGVDVNVTYNWSTQHIGDFSLALDYTYLNQYELGTSFQQVDLHEDYAGSYGFNNGLPKNRGNLQVSWNRGLHGVSALVTYAGKYNSWQNLVIDEEETDLPFTVDDFIQLDLQYSYTFQNWKGAMLRLGCRNCTGQDPPVYNYAVTAEAFHEGRGALFYLRWSQPF